MNRRGPRSGRVTPTFPSYPAIFVSQHSDRLLPEQGDLICDHCAASLRRGKGGYLTVVFGAISISYCPSCLVAVAREILERKGVKL